jgi:glycosyltransferase involved in cell wall biosynthesis
MAATHASCHRQGAITDSVIAPCCESRKGNQSFIACSEEIVRVLVPRLVDRNRTDAQALNTRSLLSRFGHTECHWHCACSGTVDPSVSSNPHVKVTQLAPWKFQPWHIALFYQQPADAIFYPGVQWFDRVGLQSRDGSFRSIPVISTLESLPGGPDREKRLSEVAGHPVYCIRLPQERLDKFDYVMRRADHIVAITPFIARMARELYGDKCSILPLGVDRKMFAPLERPRSEQSLKVLGVGTVGYHKRPEVFLGLAERFLHVQFRWIGDGPRRETLVAEVARRGLRNLDFPGAFMHHHIAEEMRATDVFVMPSRSESVSKVTQEAAASCVPCIIFGNYESPSVIDGHNGYLVWSDDELQQRLGEMLENGSLRKAMGLRGYELAQAWDWDVLAPQWELALVRLIESL